MPANNTPVEGIKDAELVTALTIFRHLSPHNVVMLTWDSPVRAGSKHSIGPIMSQTLTEIARSHADLQTKVAKLEEENRLIVSPTDLSNLIECVTDELLIQLGSFSADPDSEPDEHIPNKIADVIREWFSVHSEDQTAGLPEYENHRY